MRDSLIFLGAGLMACASPPRLPDAAQLATVPHAIATMRASAGQTLGTLRLTAAPDGVLRLTGVVAGLAPGAHGIHLHSVGLCNAPGFEGAGGHFNPAGRAHGLHNPNGPHAGDAPNIEADATGRAMVDVALAGASLDPNDRAYINDADGAAVVIHAGADDQRTDPSGNSGARVACGVVTAP